MIAALRLLVAGALAGCATIPPGVVEARRIVDRAEPIRCEIVALERQQALVTPGSDESARVAAALEKARAILKLHYRATMDEYIHVMKQISYEERQEVRRYAEAVAERCPAR